MKGLLPDEEITIKTTKRTIDLLCLVAAVGVKSVVGKHVEAVLAGHHLLCNLAEEDLAGFPERLESLLEQVSPGWQERGIVYAIGR